MLTQVFQTSGFADELVDLLLDLELLALLEVAADKLLLDAREHLDGPLVLHFLRLGVLHLRVRVRAAALPRPERAWPPGVGHAVGAAPARGA